VKFPAKAEEVAIKPRTRALNRILTYWEAKVEPKSTLLGQLVGMLGTGRGDGVRERRSKEAV
jgi:hypothetical protein